MKGQQRILITGGGGQLARAVAARLSPRYQVLAPARSVLDIADARAVREAVAAHRPDWIVNCAAYTAVDQAESERERAFLVNEAGVGFLADAAAERGARLLHVSTDYVFDGRKAGPYVEDDPTAPLNVYGASKLAGERRLLVHSVRSVILRTAWVYSESGRNFLCRILERGRQAIEAGVALPVVADQVGCPTDVHTLAAQIEEAIGADLEGIFHAAAEGSASWYEFAEEIFNGLGLAPRLVKIRAAELSRPAIRPDRVVLENRNLKAIGRSRMVEWREALRLVLARLTPAPRP